MVRPLPLDCLEPAPIDRGLSHQLVHPVDLAGEDAIRIQFAGDPAIAAKAISAHRWAVVRIRGSVFRREGQESR